MNEIACDASDGTEKALEAAQYLLSYIASNPRPKTRLHASDMALQVGSDAAFNVRPKGRSRAGGYHYLGSKNNDMLNAPILALPKVIKGVMDSAAEAEVAAIHMNAHEAVPIRQCLEEMGYPQPATRVRTDNATAKGFANITIKQKRSKAFGRRLWWLKGREAQLQFHVIWEPGIYNLADYPTKHHTGQHHKLVRPIYLYESGKSPRTIQECEAILASGKPVKKALLTIRRYKSLLAAAAA